MTTYQEPGIRWQWPYVAAAAAATAAAGLSVVSVADVTPSWGVGALRVLLFTVVAAGGLWLAIVDHRTHLLPNAIVVPLAIAVGAGTVFLAIATAEPARLIWAVAGGAGLGLFYLLLGLGGGVGLGDVKLATVLGVYLGWYGWEAPIAATVAAYLLAAPHATAVTVIRRRYPDRDSRIAFGPYLIAGALIIALTHL